MDSKEDYQYLSYSGWKHYNTCPQRYKWKYIDKKPYEDDPRSALFGLALGKIFEWFYNNQLWAKSHPKKEALSLMKKSLIYAFQEKKWDPREDIQFLEELKENLRKYIPIGIDIIKKHKLLDEVTKTEVMLNTSYRHKDYDFSIRMGGYADFIFGYKEPWLLDGKAGKKDWVDPLQLVWYATMHYLKYHVAPNRLGFIFWTYPEDPIQWIDYGGDDIRTCVKSTYDTAQKIRLKMFDYKLSNSCKVCDYKNVCEPGREHIEALAIEAKIRITSENSIFDLDDV